MTKPVDETWTIVHVDPEDDRDEYWSTGAKVCVEGSGDSGIYILDREGGHPDVYPAFLARARLAAAAPELARALLAVEAGSWKCHACSGFTHGDPGLGKPKNHEPWCALDAALRKAGVR